MYKSAYVIVTHLNEGKKINSDEITKIISANAVFERNYYDALQYKYSYKVAKKRQDLQKWISLRLDLVVQSRGGQSKRQNLRYIRRSRIKKTRI